MGSQPLLHHYDTAPFELDRTRVYDQAKDRRGNGKPAGLWVSVVGDDDWAWWCRSEEFHVDGLDAVHQVILTPANNVLWLKTVEDIDAFHRNYCGEIPEWYRNKMSEKPPADGDDRGALQGIFANAFSREYAENQRPIDWERVAKVYGGIIIAPYQWSRRLDGPFWYYGWDCASGCIWDLSAIANFQHVPTPEPSPTGRTANLDFEEIQRAEQAAGLDL